MKMKKINRIREYFKDLLWQMFGDMKREGFEDEDETTK